MTIVRFIQIQNIFLGQNEIYARNNGETGWWCAAWLGIGVLSPSDPREGWAEGGGAGGRVVAVGGAGIGWRPTVLLTHHLLQVGLTLSHLLLAKYLSRRISRITQSSRFVHFHLYVH